MRESHLMPASRSQVSSLRANGEMVRTGLVDCYWIDTGLMDYRKDGLQPVNPLYTVPPTYRDLHAQK